MKFLKIFALISAISAALISPTAQRVTDLQNDQWSVITDSSGYPALFKEFSFQNFVEAFTFMTNVAFYAESIQHHPDWSNVWAFVNITLTTHDEGGITEKDLEMARFIDGIVVKDTYPAN